MLGHPIWMSVCGYWMRKRSVSMMRSWSIKYDYSWLRREWLPYIPLFQASSLNYRSQG